MGRSRRRDPAGEKDKKSRKGTVTSDPSDLLGLCLTSYIITQVSAWILCVSVPHHVCSFFYLSISRSAPCMTLVLLKISPCERQRFLPPLHCQTCCIAQVQACYLHDVHLYTLKEKVTLRKEKEVFTYVGVAGLEERIELLLNISCKRRIDAQW